MNGTSHISVAAFVSESERAAFRVAASDIARALSSSAGASWTCDLVFLPDGKSRALAKDTSLMVISLLPELDAIEAPWSQAEQRLRSKFAALCKTGVPVFICTILRHVSSDGEPETAAALLIRIRRLNLLAAEISREMGVHVIDIDRALADMGAQRLKTDYRLGGNAAADMAGHFIALTLIENAPEQLIPFGMQDAAREIIAAGRPVFKGTVSVKPEITLKGELMAMGHGHRKQIISPVQHPVQDNYAGWLVRQVLRGTIGPGEATHRLVQAVRRRGIWQSATLLATGLSQQVNAAGNAPRIHDK